MKRIKLSCVLALICVLFCGCGGKPAAPLQVTAWKPEKVLGQKVPASSQAQMVLNKNLSVNGSGGINRFMGQYKLSDADGLSFSPLATTKMAGLSAEATAVEEKFLQSLTQTKKYKQRGNRLTFLNEKGKAVASFKIAVK